MLDRKTMEPLSREGSVDLAAVAKAMAPEVSRWLEEQGIEVTGAEAEAAR